MTSVYLAGPDVFLEDAVGMGRRKCAICSQNGFQGLFPLDAEVADSAGPGLSTRIYKANIALIRQSDAVIANLTPFRGVSADVGTVFEVAFALALGKRVFAYSNVTSSLRERVADTFGIRHGSDATGRVFSGDGMVVEDFDLPDNLMIAEAIRTQGWDIVTGPVAESETLTSLDQFEHCVRQARKILEGAKESGLAA